MKTGPRYIYTDGTMDYEWLADWQPPINMSDTFLDCLPGLFASKHTKAQFQSSLCPLTLLQSISLCGVTFVDMENLLIMK